MEEFVAELGIVLETAGVVGGGHATGVLDATHGLAHVLALEDDGETEGFTVECVGEHVDDVVTETLLELHARGTISHYAGYLADAQDAACGRGDVGEVVLAKEGKHVVLAHGIVVACIEDDVAGVGIVGEGGDGGLVGRFVATEDLLPHAQNAVRGAGQALAIGVLADVGNEGAECLASLLVTYRTPSILCV